MGKVHDVLLSAFRSCISNSQDNITIVSEAQASHFIFEEVYS